MTVIPALSSVIPVLLLCHSERSEESLER